MGFSTESSDYKYLAFIEIGTSEVGCCEMAGNEGNMYE
jgi:hypothetical protein